MYDDTEHCTQDMAVNPPPDPRVVAMQRVVDLERQHEMAQAEADRRAKQAHIVREELSQARDELNGLLGLPSNAKPMAAEMAKKYALNEWDR